MACSWIRNTIAVFVILTCLIAAQPSRANDEILVPAPRSELDVAHSYHVTLLQMALQASASDSEPPSIRSTINMVETRAMRELEKGELLNVSWMGTDEEKERRLQAIPIPTTMGLIGFRKFFVQRNKAHKFKAVTSIDHLKSLVACQGTDWPDTLILRHAGLPVATTPAYEDLFAMLNAGRCDYFPRSLHDFKQELITRQVMYPNLEPLEDVILHYPFAVYFFTSQENQALADKILQGLRVLHANGDFLRHIQTHELTRRAFPLTQHKGANVITLENPQFTQSSLRETANGFMFSTDILAVD